MSPAAKLGPPGRWLAGAALAASLSLIASATLLPVALPAALDAARVAPPVSLADVLRNVVLFLPLGGALALCGIPAWRTLGLAFALSLAIEAAQLVIPGRFSAPSDLLADSAGAWLGHRLVRLAALWLRPDARAARRLELAAAPLVAALLAATALLTAPAPPRAAYFAHWIPDVPQLHAYDGSLAAVRLGERPLPHGRLADSDAVRRELAGDFTLRLEGGAGAPTPGLGGIFLLSDEQKREVFLVGVDHEDLVVRYRSRASALGLEPAVLRVPGAWRGLTPGTPLVVGVSRRGASACIERAAERRCGLGFHAGSGWTLFAPVLVLPPLGVWLFELAWLAALFLPLGLWGRADAVSLLALALAAAPLALLSAPGWLLPTPPGLLCAVPVGWVAGRAAGLALGRGTGAR